MSSNLSEFIHTENMIEDNITENMESIEIENQGTVSKLCTPEAKDFQCPQCFKLFAYNRNLKRHMQKSHSAVIKENRASHACEDCGVSFHKIYLLKKHQKENHANVKKWHTCPICNTDYERKALLEHFSEIHNLSLNSEQCKFNSLKDFSCWKEEIEKNEKCNFKKVRGTCATGNKNYYYFECHRSGYHSYSGKGIRHTKSQGSNKMNAFCPASMNVIEYENGACCVTYIKTHVGHNNELRHICLTEMEKERLANKIASKIPFKAILDEVRDSITESGPERMHLLTNQDLHNIERQYNIGSEAVHQANHSVKTHSLSMSFEERRKHVINKCLGLLNTFSCEKELDIFEKQLSDVPRLIEALLENS